MNSSISTKVNKIRNNQFFTHTCIGSFLRKKCTRGRNCQYLHVFQNPRNEFNYFDIKKDISKSKRNKSPESRLCLSNRSSNKKSSTWSSDEEPHIHSSSTKKSRWDSDDEDKYSSRHISREKSKENFESSRKPRENRGFPERSERYEACGSKDTRESYNKEKDRKKYRQEKEARHYSNEYKRSSTSRHKSESRRY